jgi:hypothetical protein
VANGGHYLIARICPRNVGQGGTGIKCGEEAIGCEGKYIVKKNGEFLPVAILPESVILTPPAPDSPAAAISPRPDRMPLFYVRSRSCWSLRFPGTTTKGMLRRPAS